MNKVTLWLDLFCFKSVFILIRELRKVDQVYYLNTSKFSKFAIPVFSKLFKKPIVQVLDFVYSEERLNDISLFEVVHRRIEVHINKWSDSFNIDKEGLQFNSHKFKSHIKEKAYIMMFKPVEMKMLSDKFGEADKDIFIVKNTPLIRSYSDFFKNSTFYTYKLFSFSGLFIEKRDEYSFDHVFNDSYYSSEYFKHLKFSLIWFFSSMYSLLYSNKNSIHKGKSICIELNQDKIKKNGVNDFYWLKRSNIESKIYGISSIFYDSSSLKKLKKSNIFLIRTSEDILKNIKFIFCKDEVIVPTSFSYFSQTYRYIFKGLLSLVLKNSDSWGNILHAEYVVRSLFWKGVYKNIEANILWTMLDMDPDKNTKSQAMEWNKGLYIGSHWSNYPLYLILNGKCYDEVFSWGEHFCQHSFKGYADKKIHVVGYPFDYYKTLNEQVKDNRTFVISFHDNIVANDSYYSLNMIVAIHLMLIRLLEKYEFLRIILKPKRQHVFNASLRQTPELSKYIKNRKITIHLGDSESEKVPPAEVCLISDLAIGLGISTAAAECCFSGTVSFHADFTKFVNNKFADLCEGKFLYRSVVSLEKAVDNQIKGLGYTSRECKKYHEFLDPFQDGMTYKRTGSIIKKIHEELL
jgi:hypothetical protein